MGYSDVEMKVLGHLHTVYPKSLIASQICDLWGMKDEVRDEALKSLVVEGSIHKFGDRYQISERGKKNFKKALKEAK